MGWGIGVAIGWPNASAGISYAKKLIKAFKERVLSYPNSIFEAEPCLVATLAELNAIGLLDNASLVITPNAYNEGKLYDVVPNTTLGDMDVVRATTATRVNEQGLIEVVPRNLLTYSNDFSNASWIKSNGTISGTLYSNPSGVVNASKFILNNSVTSSYLGQGIINNSITSTFSVFVKPDGFNRVVFWDGFVTAKFVVFDLILGTIVNTSGATGTIINVDNGWFKCTMSANMPNNTIGWLISPIGNSATSPFDPQVVGDGVKGIQVYAAQVENFATATTYFPTTTRLNIPRIDYTNGSCPSLLVEPQRTNYQTNSNSFTSWTAPIDGVTLTPNTMDTLSPSGNNDSTKMTQTGGNRRIFDVVSLASGVSTYSLYVKAGTGSVITLLTSNLTFFLTYNLITKTITTYNGTGTITELKNGWFKITATGTQSNLEVIQIRSENNNGEALYIYGAQFEQGSYATSYIPTVASTVTRNADVISKTGISSLIGQTEGTMFWDGYFLNSNNTQVLMSIHDFANNKRIEFFAINSEVFGYLEGSNSVIVGSKVITNGRHKIAIAYKSGDLAFYIDGIQVGVSNTLFTIALTALRFDYFGGFYLNKQYINSAQIYKTRLTNTELAQLTTL